MKKIVLVLLSLVLFLTAFSLTACKKEEGSDVQGSGEDDGYESESGGDTDGAGGVLVDIKNGELIESANAYANGVQAFFKDSSREKFTVKNGEKVLKAFKDLEHKRNMKAPMIEFESIRDLYSLLLLLVQGAPSGYLTTSNQQKIAKAIDYISEHYKESVTNDELAAVLGMSTVYFRKLFAKAMGISPIAFVHELRIEKAKEILKSDYGSLSDVATSLGYASLYDFSRDFKKHTGLAPSKY